VSALTAWVVANPHEIDVAVIRVHMVGGSPGFIASWDVGGLPHQTHHERPSDVAAAYRRLADRIDNAEAEYLASLHQEVLL
jgi:hypothetical protein